MAKEHKRQDGIYVEKVEFSRKESKIRVYCGHAARLGKDAALYALIGDSRGVGEDYLLRLSLAMAKNMTHRTYKSAREMFGKINSSVKETGKSLKEIITFDFID